MSFIQYSNIKSSMVQRSNCYPGPKAQSSQESGSVGGGGGGIVSGSAGIDTHHRKPLDVHKQEPIISPLSYRTDAHFHSKAYRNLGKSGLRISNIVLGTWLTFGSQLTDETADDILTYAYEHGVNAFDTSEVYAAGKAEITLGKILKKKGWRRSSYIVITKILCGGKAETEKGLSRKHIIEGLRASLDRLQLDYVDVILANKSDPRTPMEEIARAFSHVINQGWALYWGTSKWSATEIMEIYSVCRQFNLTPPITEQTEYNFFRRESVELHLPELFQKIGLGIMATCPLMGGAISGKYVDGVPINSRASLKGQAWYRDKILSDVGKKHQLIIKDLQPIADKLDCTLAQLAIAWCLKNETVHCVVLGVSSMEQLIENLKAVQIVNKLNSSILHEVNEIINSQYNGYKMSLNSD